MHRIALLENPVREYAWGSRTVLARLLGEPAPSAEPQAELWIGAHPTAPSFAVVEGVRLSLAELVARDPEAVLGRRVLARFGPRLPFLAKLLAAAKPLSLQAHPDAAQAREGYAREQARGIPLHAEGRSYRDASHKPELLCALEPFEALCGFRAPAEIRALLEALPAPGVREHLHGLLAGPQPLAGLLAGLLRLAPERRRALVAAAAAAAAGSSDPALAWIPRLAAEHPADAGALAPLYLRHLRLAPGEAIHLPARELHSYLGGFGIEVMASSDNVLRGGLTAKAVDVDELLRILRFAPGSVAPLRPEPDASGALVYRTPAQEFELSRLEVAPGRGFALPAERGVEVALCMRGALRVAAARSAVDLTPGRSALAPAAAGAYAVEGDGEAWRVRVAPQR